MIHVIPLHNDGQRPDQVEEFILGHEWMHQAYAMMLAQEVKEINAYFTMNPDKIYTILIENDDS